MNNQLNDIRYSKSIFLCHVTIYISFLIYSISACAFSKDMTVEGTCMVSFLSLAMLVFDILLFGNKMKIERNSVFCVFYYFIRLTFVASCYFILSVSSGGDIFLAALFLMALEFLLYIPFDESSKRAIWYIFFSIMFIAVDVVIGVSRFYERNISLGECVADVIAAVVVTFGIIAASEIIARMWTYFIKQLFAQNRAVEELNDANDTLQEHQAKIKKVNELLGLQKIELQAANRKINRSHDEMSVQNEISSTIAASVGKEDMLQRVVKILQIRLDMNVAIVVLEADDSLLVPGEESQGRFTAVASTFGEKFEQSAKDMVKRLKTAELLFLTKTYIRNSMTDTIHFIDSMDEKYALPSLICIPIYRQEERLGTLLVGKITDNAFMDSRAFYENIASQLAIGISNARLYAKMNDMAIRDGLTRIYNRGHLTQILDQYIAEAIKNKTSVSLALFDIDKFKMINDTYGHQCGDEVIRHVAAFLNESAIQHGGIAGRYGGEEFVLAFLDKKLDETNEIIKDVHNKIRSEVVEFGSKHVSVRVSAGIASYPETCSNPGDLLTRADWSMYHSKRNGRDQITIDGEHVSDKM